MNEAIARDNALLAYLVRKLGNRVEIPFKELMTPCTIREYVDIEKGVTILEADNIMSSSSDGGS